jgi:hypothetical protein
VSKQISGGVDQWLFWLAAPPGLTESEQVWGSARCGLYCGAAGLLAEPEGVGACYLHKSISSRGSELRPSGSAAMTTVDLSHTKTVEETLLDYKVTEDGGLTNDTVLELRQKYGYNGKWKYLFECVFFTHANCLCCF